MSGPKYSEFELERTRKEKIQVIEKIKSCIPTAKYILERIEQELSTIEQLKELVENSPLSEEQKKKMKQKVSERKTRLKNMEKISKSICDTDYSDELDELKKIYAVVSKDTQSLVKMESDVYDPYNSYNKAMRKLEKSFDSQSSTPEYTLEDALSELHKQHPDTSSDGLSDDLNVFRNNLLSEAQEILCDPRITDEDKSRIEQAIVFITKTDKQDDLQKIKSQVLNEIVYKMNKCEVLYSEYRRLIAAKIDLQKRLREDVDKVEERFTSISILQTKICKLEHEISELEKQVAEKAEHEEISRCIDETMEELGYNLVGKKNGEQESTMVLFRFDNSGNGIRVIRKNNGETEMRVVGIRKSRDDKSSWTEGEIANAQNAFCGAYSDLLRKLEKKGVIVREDSDKRMPPSLRYWKTAIEEDYSGQSQADSEYREYAGQSQLGSEDRKKEKSNNQKNTKKKKLVMRLD